MQIDHKSRIDLEERGGNCAAKIYVRIRKVALIHIPLPHTHSLFVLFCFIAINSLFYEHYRVIEGTKLTWDKSSGFIKKVRSNFKERGGWDCATSYIIYFFVFIIIWDEIAKIALKYLHLYILLIIPRRFWLPK